MNATFFLFTVVAFSPLCHGADRANDHAEIMATATPLIKRVIEFADRQGDTLIINACAATGIACGQYLGTECMTTDL